MLEVLTKFICFILMALVGFNIIKTTIRSDVKITSLQNLFLLSILIIAPFMMYKIEYTGTYTMITYMLSIITYKLVFKQNVSQSFINGSIVMVVTFIADIITTIIMINFVNVVELRSIWYVRLISNVLFTIICTLFCLLLRKQKLTYKINKKLEYQNDITSFFFMTILVIVFICIACNIYGKIGWNSEYLLNIIIVIMFVLLLMIFTKDKDNYIKLTNEYDTLFNYVQNFEDWIEKEQLNRHEYKNQLAVLRDITKEKKTKKKIDEILEDNINIEGDIVNQLKTLPKGGIKGLMYYKFVIAQKEKIDLTVNVSIRKRSILNKLSEKQIKDLCKLIGIYFDNAIEAAKETRKKNVLVEIYELKDKANIVFSNTFKKTKELNKRYEKGVSSKGKGHGNGLYFAKKIISRNNWLKEEQEIIDRFYIQKLSILKLEK